MSAGEIVSAGGPARTDLPSGTGGAPVAAASTIGLFFAVLWSNIKYLFGFRDSARSWSEVLGPPAATPGAPPTAPPVAPPPTRVGPVMPDDVKAAARQYLAAHPEISELESYTELNAVARMRDGILAILAAQGIRGGRVLGPDGQPYYQLIAVGNPGDPQATTFRVTAGGGPVRRAIECVYSDGPIPWNDVR